jgi:hypothetical protein
MPGRDEQWITACFTAPYPCQLLTFIQQRRQRAGLIGKWLKLAAQPFFCHANRRHIHQQPKVAGDPQTARMRNAMPINKQQIRLLRQLLPRRQQSRYSRKERKPGI